MLTGIGKVLFAFGMSALFCAYAPSIDFFELFACTMLALILITVSEIRRNWEAERRVKNMIALMGIK